MPARGVKADLSPAYDSLPPWLPNCAELRPDLNEDSEELDDVVDDDGDDELADTPTPTGWSPLRNGFPRHCDEDSKRC